MTTPSVPTLRTLRFGHSPDADDAFMFYGFHTGDAVGRRAAASSTCSRTSRASTAARWSSADLEITAVSAHAYAFLADRYAILACGASMGLGYGPVVVAREGALARFARAARASRFPGR